MLKEKERWILFYDKSLEPIPDGAREIDINEVLPGLYARQQAGESVKLIHSETAAIRISDMEVDSTNEIAVFLLQYGDMEISDPVFSNLTTGELRIAPKLDGEGVAISAHMLVSLKPSILDGSYLTLLEDVPGIGKTKLEPFFTSEFKQVSDHLTYKEDGLIKHCRPRLSLEGHSSQTIKESLERGYLKGVELIKSTTVSELDEPDYIKKERYIAKLNLVRINYSCEIVSFINRLKDKAKKLDYSEMNVIYKREEGRQKSIPISTAREDIGDVLFSRYEMISLSTPLPQCSDKISGEVVQKMKKMLLQSRV